jgi:soluble lytic murein transglycosylase-like protein
MMTVAAFSPPKRVIRWRSLVDEWCIKLKVSQSLILAVIQIESGGNEKAIRYEPAYEKRYILGNPVWVKRCQKAGISTKDAATSYGLMQLMFPTAWGFNCHNPKELFDPSTNIRFGTALIAQKLKKFTICEALAAYNGGDGAVSSKNQQAWQYSEKVYALYGQYKEYMKATFP